MSDFFCMLIGPIFLIHIVYGTAVYKKNLSLIDTAWGLGFILISLGGIYSSALEGAKENMIFLLVLIWGLRLSLFIHSRNSGKGEDFRYANWRREWGERTNIIAYFKVYWLQFLLMMIVGLPLFSVHLDKESNFSALNIFGILIWVVGFLWEAIADHQKNVFKKNPQNQHKVFQGGLWALSRHPNYFGEALLWWGIGMTAFEIHYWWAMLGPLFITFLLWKVSGVPLVEARHAQNPEYQAYASHTPVLIPDLRKIFKT
jgi:steroid 5-alpha reductase family enzyme